MITTRSGSGTSNQQELSVLFSNLSLLTSSQGQPQEIMVVAPTDGLKDNYLDTLYFSTSEHLKLHNKAIVGLPESYRYDLIRSKWTYFYKELEDAISTFGFKASVLIVTVIVAHNASTEVKDIIFYYPYTTQVMLDSHYEILWADNSVSGLGRFTEANYGAELDQ